MRSASCASIMRAVNISSIARSAPIAAGRLWASAVSAVRPRFICATWKRASSAAMRMSQDIAMPRPMPSA